MQIIVNTGEVNLSEATEHLVHTELERALKHVSGRLTRVEVHLHDVNGPKEGRDKHVVMEARPAGLDPIVAEEKGMEWPEVIHQASSKLERAVRHKVERHDEQVRSG